MTGHLLSNLGDLLVECRLSQVQFVLGGGLGLFLKQTNMPETSRTLLDQSHWPVSRTTSDIDVFLNTEVIFSHDKMRAMRAILDKLGYTVKVETWQFGKDVDTKAAVQVDLMTGRIQDSDRSKVKISEIRVRPAGSSANLQAHLTPEAIFFDQDPEKCEVRGSLASSGKPFHETVLLVNSFPYLLMKLHAVYDRINDPKKELGRHHALDVYRIIAMMSETDFESAKTKAADWKNDKSCKHAAYVIKTLFKNAESAGSLRLQEHDLFKKTFDLTSFLSALDEIFTLCLPQEQVSKRQQKLGGTAESPIVSEGPIFAPKMTDADLQPWLEQIDATVSLEDLFNLLDKFRPLNWNDEQRATAARTYIRILEGRLKPR